MNVLLANSTCKVGGVSTFMLSLREALVRSGHHCELFFFAGGSMQDRLPPHVPARFGSLADCLRLVAAGGVDVVHANNVDWPTGITAARDAGARLIVTAHKVRVNGTYGWMRSNCDAFTSVSRWIAHDLQATTDTPVIPVPNGIDTERFRPGDAADASSAPVVAWVGRGGSAHKRLDRFARLAPLLRALGCRIWVLDQHGPAALADLYGPETASMLTRAAERWEAVPYDRMPDVYREVGASGGCLVSTSQSEGLPLTLLEAQACGCPVVASDVRGNNECVVEGGAGLLYPQDLEVSELSRRVAGLLNSGSVLNHDRLATAERVREQFSVDRMASRYEELYRSSPTLTVPLSRRVRAQARLSPITNWRRYAEYRWGTASAQYAAAVQLHAQGESRAAAAAARSSARVAPTLYLKPARLRRLLTMRGSIGASATSAADPDDGRQSKGHRMNALLRWFEVTPREKAPRTCGDEEILKGRGPSQMDWYAFAAGLTEGMSVLDIGCGSGEGLKLLSDRARTAMGIDLDARLTRPDVHVEIKSIEEMPDKSFDAVVCLDVIEHVTNDRAFAAHLVRVARRLVIVTTPNYTMSRNQNPYHVREYTPREFERIFEGYGDVTLYAGSARGAERDIVRRRFAYFLVNALYAYKPTLLAAKVLKRLLGVKIWKHNAVVLRLQDETATATPTMAA
jgi:glycosyltransferase involved in cell wall biosynthesis/2-polyprenyl-3-methyl-5-hydroxy-6-metoxy-1,4-benzoquinol methylase